MSSTQIENTNGSETSVGAPQTDIQVLRDGKNVVLALSSNLCFCVPVELIERAQKLSDLRLAYELESILPVDAEEIALGRTKDLIVVARRSTVQPTIDVEESRGNWIGAISPLALLAIQGWLLSRKPRNLSGLKDFRILWSPDNGDRNSYFDLATIRNGSIVFWKVISREEITSELFAQEPSLSKAEPMALATGFVSPNTPPLVRPTSDYDSTKEAISSSQQLLGLPTIVLGRYDSKIETFLEKCLILDRDAEASQSEYAQGYSAQLLSGQRLPWIDLRSESLRTSNPLAPLYPSISLFLGTLFVLLLGTIGLLVWDCMSIDRNSYENQVAQEAVFKKLFPNQSIPTDIAGRLRSEQQKLTQGLSELDKVPPVHSSLPILVRFLESLPVEAVLRIDRIRVQSSDIVSVEGAVKTLQDLESLIAALRNKGFQFTTPNIQQMADGFTLRLEKLTYKAPK